MGYMHINNLAKSQDVLLFKQVYCQEKIHGTSSHILWKEGVVTLFSGGAKHESFVKIFDVEKIKNQFLAEFGVGMTVCIYGEAYGGNMQGMSATYGKELKFIVFDVEVNGNFIAVPKAHNVATKFGLEFVDYVLVDATIENLDKERLKESVQAIRNGCGAGHKREGIVIRPPIEVRANNGERVMCKYKNDDFEERKTPQKIVDPSQVKIIENAEKAADEFVTAMRLEHVMDKIFLNGEVPDISRTGDVVKAMVEDVMREAAGEIVDNKQTRNAIGKKTVQLFKAKLNGVLKQSTTPT